MTKVCKRCTAELGDEYEFCPYDGWQLDAAPGDPLLGKIFNGKYEIQSILGKGGMSVVYKARDVFMERIVAVKILRSNLVADKISIQRFKQEAQAAALLDHPNILRVYDFGITPDEQAFLIMECFEGQTLAQVLDDQTRITPDRGLRIMRQVCDGLEQAHKKGVVHRDLKPSNLCLVKQEDGHDLVKIVDFGIAKLTPQDGREKQQLTQTGQIFGSPLFMSPEQCQGKVVDPRSDIYSLGCLMYEALTGSPPFMGPTAFDTMNMHVTDPPRPLRKSAPDSNVPPELENPILRCLEKDPSRRYQTAAELKADLPPLPEELAAGQKVWTPSWYGSIKHNPAARFTLIICLSVLIPVALIVCFWPGSPDSRGTLLEKALWNFNIAQADSHITSGDYNAAKDELDRAYRFATLKFRDRSKTITTLQLEMKLGAKVSEDPDGRWKTYTKAAFAELSELYQTQAFDDYVAEVAFYDNLADPNNHDSDMRKKDIIESRAGHAEMIARELDAMQLFIYEEKLLQKALTIDEKLLTPNHYRIADLNMRLADCYEHMQYTPRVAKLLEEALAVDEQCPTRGKESPETISVLLRLGQFLRDQSVFDRAGVYLQDALQRAMSLHSNLKKEDGVLVKRYKTEAEELAQAQRSNDPVRMDKAEEKFDKTKALIATLDQKMMETRSLLIEGNNSLGDYFNQLGKKDQSDKYFKVGKELYDAEEQAADTETKRLLEARKAQ